MNTEIVGTIVQDPLDDRLLLYSIDADTLPQDTLEDVSSVINPLLSGPGAGLAVATVGQRYLIVEDIGTQSSRITIAGNLLGGTSPLNDLHFVVTVVGSAGEITSIGDFYGNSIIETGSYVVNVPGYPFNAQLVITKTGASTTYSESSISYTIVSGGSGFTVSSITAAWGNLVAHANDIIEYDGTEWVVSFDSVTANQLGSIEYVTNINTDVQYRYTGGVWMKSYEGWYEEGDYSIVI
jgi:hypothetical protein